MWILKQQALLLQLFVALLPVTAELSRPQPRKRCIIPHTEGEDDTPAIVQTFQNCSINSDIIFEEGVKYNSWNTLAWTNLSNVRIYLDGSFHLPNNITAVQEAVSRSTNRPSTYSPTWIYVQGERVDLIGSLQKDGGSFHGYGEQWWDVGNRTLRPGLIAFNVSTGTISNIKVIKPIGWGFNLPGTNIMVKNHYVDAAPKNGTRDQTTSFPFNTDGFNVSGQNVTIDGYWGMNGDDCVSIVNGADNVVAKNGYCGFSSHGLSIGSLGKGGAVQHVQNILFQNWTMDNAVYGARFKSWTGGRGSAVNITWRDIKVLNVSTPIFITQNYYDQDKGPRPNNTNETSTTIDSFFFENFEGYIGPNWTDGTCISNPCWNYVEGIDSTQGIILDLYNDTATNLQFRNIHVHPYNKDYNETTVICDPSTLAPEDLAKLGFECVDGPFKVTPISRK